MIKRLPTIWETRVQSLGQEDLLEKEMATRSSILAWKIPWTEEPGSLQSIGLSRVGNLIREVKWSDPGPTAKTEFKESTAAQRDQGQPDQSNSEAPQHALLDESG